MGADRAIIIDPDWNPANDNQCIDRIYRIGQNKDVIVYRLITANSVEEKIYMRQVYKSSINNAAVESSMNTSNTVKYFNDTELTQLIDFNPDIQGCHAFNIIRNGCSFTEDTKFENGSLNRSLNIEATPTN